MSEAKALSNEQAKAAAHIDELVRECSRGGKDEEWQAEMLARGAGLNVDEIHRRFEAARELWKAQKPKPVEPTEIMLPSRDVKHPTLERSPLYRSLFTEGERAEIRARRAKEKADAEVKARAEAEASRRSEEPQQTTGKVPVVPNEVEALSDARALVTVAQGLPAVRGELLDLPAVIPASEAGATIEAINNKHTVISNYGGKCMVLSWELSDLNDRQIVPVFQTFDDFAKRYSHRSIATKTERGTKDISVGKYWLSHPRRRQYEGVTFDPSAPAVKGNKLNLWQGFAVDPVRGDWHLMERHIQEVLGSGDPRAYDYIVRWDAWMFQYAAKPAEVAIVFRGDEGTGKGVKAKCLMDIFGVHAKPISQERQLTGDFSGHLQHCVFLFVDEAFWAGSKGIEGRLKSLLTEETITIEPKYVNAFPVPNRLHIMMASNEEWVVPAGPNSRRFQVFDVSKRYMQDADYFARLYEELNNGGREAMLFDLLRMDLRGWHPRRTYATPALIEQRQRSLHGTDAAVEEWLQFGSLPGDWPNYPNRAKTSDLLLAARRHNHYEKETAMVEKLVKLFGEGCKLVKWNPKTPGEKQKRGHEFPPLWFCREAWERSHGGLGKWRWQQPSLREWGEQRETFLDRMIGE